MTDAEIDAIWMVSTGIEGEWNVYTFAREIERLTLARAAQYLNEFGDVQMTGIGAARQINSLTRRA